jgi:hypothetical protein
MEGPFVPRRKVAKRSHKEKYWRKGEEESKREGYSRQTDYRTSRLLPSMPNGMDMRESGQRQSGVAEGVGAGS